MMFTAGGTKKRTLRVRLLPGGIRARLFLLIALVLLPMLLLVGWIYRERYETRRAQAIQTELEVAHGVATTFSAFLEDIRRTSHAAGQAILTFEPYTEAKANRLLESIAAQYPSLRGLNWVNPDGRVLASSQPELIGGDLSSRSYFRQVLVGRSWAIGEMTPEGKDVAAPVFGVATAVRDAEGILRGAVVAGVDPDGLGELTLTQQRPAGGAYAIFDHRGALVYRSPPEPLSWAERTQWIEADPLLRQALETGEAQVGEVRLETLGGRWFSARVPLPNTGWAVGSGRSRETALVPVRQGLVMDIALAALIASAAFLLAWVVARSIAWPIRRLEQDAETMGAGQVNDGADFIAPDEVRRLRGTVTGMASDLLQRAEALRQSEEKFRAVFEQAAVGMGRVGFADARWIDVNEAFCRMLGYSSEELCATPWPEITHPEDVDLDLVPFRRMAAGELESYSVEKRFIHKEGRNVWARLTLSLVRDAEGRPDYEIAVIENVTERKQAEAELHLLAQELERRVEERTAALTEANQELEAFTYSVSHDLRAPLRHITSFVELLGKRYAPVLDEQGERYVRIIGEAGRRMGALVDDLLTFSRLGRATVNKRPVDLSGLVEEVRGELAPEAEGRRVEWRIGALPQVQADPVLLRAAITNLLSNALKYTRPRDPAVIEVEVRATGEEVVCSVRDNGVGFDPRYADKLFGVFQRLHATGEFEGTGIGLASVRRIVQRHGGRTWAEGEVDQGAVFHFSLPKEGADR